MPPLWRKKRNGNSKILKEDSMSSFVKISHLYGTSCWSTRKNPVLILLPLATLETATWKLSSRQLKHGLPSLHLMIFSNTELMLILNRLAVTKYLLSNSTAKILPSVKSETKHSVQATSYAWTKNCQKQYAYVSVLILYVGMLFLFWIHGCWFSSAMCASHLNVDEWL